MGIETILLMVPQLRYIVLVMYILLLGTLAFSTKILVDTFRNYKEYDDFDYKLIYWIFYIVVAVIISIAGFIVLLIF